MRAALCLALAAAAFAAVPTHDWPLTPEESVRMEREHAAVCDGLSAQLDGVARRRKAYQGSADPDAALEDWHEDFKALQPALDRAFALNKKHNEGIRATDMLLVVRAMRAAKTDDRTYSDVSPEYIAVNDANNRIDVLMKRMLARYGEENGLYKDAARERARRREHEAENRQMLAALAAAGVFFLAIAVWVKRRPKPPPTTSVIKLN